MTGLFAVILPMGVIGPWQWVIIALVIILLFGGKKIPEKDIQEIKAEIVKDDDEKKDAKESK